MIINSTINKTERVVNSTIDRKYGVDGKSIEADIDIANQRVGFKQEGEANFTYIDLPKLEFNDLTQGQKDSLKLTFDQLTQAEKDSLKGSDANVTSENIATALGYTPADDTEVIKGILNPDGTERDKDVNGKVRMLVDYVIPEQFGADGTQEKDSLGLRSAIETGKEVRLLNRRYFYDGAEITNNNVKIIGAKMPKINATYTGLEDGSIIEGLFFCSGKYVHVENFGVDVGSDTSVSASDGLKCTTIKESGAVLHAENVISILKDKNSPFHSTLFEGYDKFTGENIVGVHGLFSCVIKCKNVNLKNIFGERSGTDGLFIKSDSVNGTSENVNINGVFIDGNLTQTVGVRVQATDTPAKNIRITGIDVNNCPTGIRIQATNSYVEDAYISGRVKNSNNTGVLCLAENNNIINNITIKDIQLIVCNNKGLEYSGDIYNNTLTNFYANTSSINAIIVGSKVKDSFFNNININSNGTLGQINYNNSSLKNKIGSYNCLIVGSGKPIEGYKEENITGGGALLSPDFNSRSNSTFIKAKLTSNTTVTSISIFAYETELFPIGTILTILNDSGFTLTINNNYSGKILNYNGSPISLTANQTVSYIFGGSVWHEIK